MMPIDAKLQKNGWLYTLGGLIIVIGLWSVLSYSNIVSKIFLPTPIQVARSLGHFLASGKFFIALGYSFTRILVATLLAALVGVPIGIITGYSFKIRKTMMVLLEPMRYLPITAVLPLLILWLGIGELMKVMFLFFGIVFYLVPLVTNAVDQVRKEYLLVSKDLGLTAWETIRNVIWPAALPQIWDSIIVVNGIGWTYVVLAEIINAKNGLGYLINIAGRLQRSADVFAGLILITLVALLSDRVLRFIRNKYFFW